MKALTFKLNKMKIVIQILCMVVCMHTANAQNSSKRILKKIPKAVQIDLWKTATFNEGKIVSLKIADIKRRLPTAKYNQLINSFGLSADNEGYKCSGPGECIASSSYICNPEFCSDNLTSVDFDFASNKKLWKLYKKINFTKGQVHKEKLNKAAKKYSLDTKTSIISSFNLN